MQCYSQPRGHSTPLQGRHPHTDLYTRERGRIPSYQPATEGSPSHQSLLSRFSSLIEFSLSQTAYQRGVSCADATFTCQGTISKFTRDGDSVYSCFYDLASAFDTVEYPVLLYHRKNSGITGETWRLIKDWYTDVRSYVRVGKATSSPISISQGVSQGSALSPLLFIDPLLIELKSRSCGPVLTSCTILHCRNWVSAVDGKEG